MFQERRRAIRVRAYRPVRLHQSATPHVVETLTKDLTAEGLRCLAPVLIPVGSEVGIELVLSSGNEPVSCRGRAIWFRTLPSSEQFEIGIAFSEESEAIKRRLSGYLDRILSKAAFATL
jgi:hypothetical protein